MLQDKLLLKNSDSEVNNYLIKCIFMKTFQVFTSVPCECRSSVDALHQTQQHS